MRGKKWLALLAVAVMLLGMVSLQVSAEEHTDADHKWVLTSTVAPTCETGGYSTYTCSVCNTTSRQDEKPAIGHKYQSIITKTPTCTEMGVETFICQNDSSHTYTQAVHMKPHSMTGWITLSEPKCEVAGQEMNKCTTCETQTETRAIKALEHQWGSWTTPTPATCTTTGVKMRKCSVCGVSEQETLPALGHKWETTSVKVAATCTTTGEDNQTCANDPSHKQTVVTQALGHDWGAWKETKAPDCTHAGVSKRVCARVSSHVEEKAIPALGHKPSGVWEVTREPSLNEKGLRVQYCTVCGEVVKSQTFAPAGYTYGLRAWAYGPLGGQVNPALSGTTARVVYIDMTQEGTFRYPLVTEDGWNIGTIEVLVAGGTIRVSMEKASEPTVLKFRYWYQFPDAASVTSAKLMAEYDQSLPFDMPVKVEGESCLIVVRTDANYYKGRQNQQFSDMLMNLNGTGSYADEVQAALEALGLVEAQP